MMAVTGAVMWYSYSMNGCNELIFKFNMIQMLSYNVYAVLGIKFITLAWSMYKFKDLSDNVTKRMRSHVGVKLSYCGVIIVSGVGFVWMDMVL